MSHKRTKKDVEEAYRRGFEAGFMVRPNPIAMILRSMWRKHELKKLKRAYEAEVNRPYPPTQPIGRVTSINETPGGLVVRGILHDDRHIGSITSSNYPSTHPIKKEN